MPDDVAITGFGCFEVSQVANPAITTVRVHADRIGREVVKVLEGIFAGSEEVTRVDVGSELVPGGTS